MEPPVVRSRGRPRKRRREEDGTVAGDPKTFPEAKKAPPVALVGRYVLKEFRGNTVLLGKVVRYESGLYRVVYESGGFEDLDSIAIRRILLLDSYFDDDLIRRKGELEESVLPKIAEVRERGSSELHGDLLVESEEERDETDDESCSEARDLSSDSETPIPSAPTLPPSSGTIGVPESCVLNLLSVYGFLRSFSIRLFLSPFTLDEFVGALNCKVSNTLLDAIHISLMRVLRRHLENISPDGSRRATKCLRCIDWSLLDALTWPVFTFQYLAIYGYTKGPEWKGFYNEIFHGEYYLLSASRKLMILQILCDDVLASEEFKAEMNMREESEVGIDYDNEDSLPTEIGPRRVHPRYSKTTACKDSETKKYVSELNAEDVDGNGDECRLCGMDGTLLCCDGCPAVYHSRCIGVMKMHIPDGEWYCPECKINMIGPSIARGTSLKGAEVFGKDLYGQVFMGTCDHLLVSEGHVSDNLGKATSGNTYLLAKAFSQTASRFFWPSSEKKLIEVPRERCGWCLSCKALISSKKGCMLNHAALSATKNAMKILSGLAPVRIGEGIIPSIATYVIYMEESLRGLIVGPFISECYRRHWRKQVERATSFSDIKPLLLKLEENIRTIAFCGDWVKLMDDWLAEFSTIQSAAVTLGTTQKGATCGRRKKQLSINKVTAGACPQNFVWWHGGKFSKSVFQKAVLPKTMARKAARQGGSRKISGILYADGSEIPKRSRQVVWRAAVQISRNATQLALQVRYLDFHIRWNDLIRPEHNLLDVKGQDTEASAFRNANIHEKRIVEGKILYRVAFGSQKHLPSRVMKHVEVERGPEGKEKFWFSEKRIPLYLVKEYEMRNGKMLSDKEYMYITSQLHKRQLKATYKDIFFYLTCKRDKLNMLSCSVCQLGVLIGNALKCSACQGYCHTGCSVSSTVSTCEEVEFLATCKQCHHAKLLTQKESCNESPTSPLLLEGQEQSTSAVLKGSGPKCDGQELMSSRTKNSRSDTKRFASDFSLETKGRSRNCSWGIIWKKKNNEDTGFDFRLKNILLKGGSGLPQLEPVCRLCQKPYNSDLMYICCETCKHWYHAEAVELEESRLFDVLGFKCCKCRRIKSPVCPFSDLSYRTQEDKRSSRASKKDYFGGDSDSGTPIDRSTCEPATPICPAVDFSRQDNDPLLFSLSSVELLAEPELDANCVGNTVSGPGLPKISKRERENNGSFRGNLHAEFSTSNEMLSKSVKDLSPSVEDASANCSLLKDPEIVNYHEFVDFEPHTYFSLTELLHSDENIQSEEADASRVFSGCLKNSSCVPEGCGTVNLASNCEPTNLLQGNVYSCQQCSQKEPLPDLHCEICRIWIHRQCSPWVESPSRLASWRCGDCREWR
ncbi:DDT domain-containing protein PTM isoform X2 [Vigna angularis]|uniref:DDT domain-containing protein PTM isoform X2 n=1 Tax=Phaseolus angularis TaxID=3914 RepID=UPI0022B4625D|nr:DDT domain-containing protein PTM isoform X2 [Vigna angularis]